MMIMMIFQEAVDNNYYDNPWVAIPVLLGAIFVFKTLVAWKSGQHGMPFKKALWYPLSFGKDKK